MSIIFTKHVKVDETTTAHFDDAGNLIFELYATISLCTPRKFLIRRVPGRAGCRWIWFLFPGYKNRGAAKEIQKEAAKSVLIFMSNWENTKIRNRGSLFF